MGDWGQSVLTQYDLNIQEMKKARGSLLCVSGQEVYALQEYTGTALRLQVELKLLEYLAGHGFSHTDRPVPDREGNYLNAGEDGKTYVLRQWFQASECSVQSTQDLVLAVRNLALLHRLLRDFPLREYFSDSHFTAASLTEEWSRHNQELWRIRNFMRSKRRKTDFERCALESFSAVYSQAQEALAGLEASGYDSLLQTACARHYLCHGSYNYHNVLIGRRYVATTCFQHFTTDVQLMDLYHFCRKILEKRGWDVFLWKTLLDTYQAVLPLGESEHQVLYLLFLYPEKYWKQMNFYYNNSKSWISGRSIEKLTKAARQIEERRDFLKKAFRR